MKSFGSDKTATNGNNGTTYKDKDIEDVDGLTPKETLHEGDVEGNAKMKSLYVSALARSNLANVAGGGKR